MSGGIVRNGYPTYCFHAPYVDYLFETSCLFTVPRGARSLDLTLLSGGAGGGGGGGGNLYHSGTGGDGAGPGGGGGGGSGRIQHWYNLPVIATQQLNITVGAGGSAGQGTSYAAGLAGGPGGSTSMVRGDTTLTLAGGNGGKGGGCAWDNDWYLGQAYLGNGGNAGSGGAGGGGGAGGAGYTGSAQWHPGTAGAGADGEQSHGGTGTAGMGGAGGGWHGTNGTHATTAGIGQASNDYFLFSDPVTARYLEARGGTGGPSSRSPATPPGTGGKPGTALDGSPLTGVPYGKGGTGGASALANGRPGAPGCHGLAAVRVWFVHRRA